MVQSSSTDRVLKYCNIKEYTVVEKELIPPSKGWGYVGRIRLEFEFMVPRETTYWSDKFVKTYRQEYLIMSTIGLIGTVGGTLGLFVGFSIFEYGFFVFERAKNACSLIKGNSESS